MSTHPEECFKFCLKCGRDTLHRFQVELKGVALYACTTGCGSPARAISDAAERTPAATELKIAAQRAVDRKLDGMKTRKYKKRGSAETPAPKPRRKKTVAKIATPPPARTALEQLIDSRISASKMSGGLTEADVVAIINKTLGLGGEAPDFDKIQREAGDRVCPTGKHLKTPNAVWCIRKCGK